MENLYVIGDNELKTKRIKKVRKSLTELSYDTISVFLTYLDDGHKWFVGTLCKTFHHVVTTHSCVWYEINDFHATFVLRRETIVNYNLLKKLFLRMNPSSIRRVVLFNKRTGFRNPHHGYTTSEQGVKMSPYFENRYLHNFNKKALDLILTKCPNIEFMDVRSIWYLMYTMQRTEQLFINSITASTKNFKALKFSELKKIIGVKVRTRRAAAEIISRKLFHDENLHFDIISFLSSKLSNLKKLAVTCNIDPFPSYFIINGYIKPLKELINNIESYGFEITNHNTQVGDKTKTIRQINYECVMCYKQCQYTFYCSSCSRFICGTCHNRIRRKSSTNTCICYDSCSKCLIPGGCPVCGKQFCQDCIKNAISFKTTMPTTFIHNECFKNINIKKLIFSKKKKKHQMKKK